MCVFVLFGNLRLLKKRQKCRNSECKHVIHIIEHHIRTTPYLYNRNWLPSAHIYLKIATFQLHYQNFDTIKCCSNNVQAKIQYVTIFTYKFLLTVKRQFKNVLGCHFSEAKIVNIDGMQFSDLIMNKLN